MATDISNQLAAAAPPTVAVVRGVRDDQLDAPTPCAEYAVRDLLNHLFLVVVNFQTLATRSPADFSTTPDYVGDLWRGGWRDRFEAETTRLVGAWAEPSSLEGVSPGMGLPQRVVGSLVLVDLTVHGWDLARATGQPYAPDAGAAAALRPTIEQMAPQARAMGVFGEARPVPEGADDVTTILALSGRDPRWEPPAR